MDGRLCNSRINLQKSIILSESQKQVLSKHAKTHEPNESCALLIGKKVNEKDIVEEVILLENIDESPVSFTPSDEQYIQAHTKASENGMDVVAIFHSHPNSEAFPSNKDKQYMKNYPVVWIIFSGVKNNFKAFELENDINEVLIV